ncbi:hypothetical protein SAMN02990966_03358 [Rhodospirillales bacterium URHD0017]|nr:hypothetical protein SAMN02990966_03358 [Rhodospirillales bacterium URHD0017]
MAALSALHFWSRRQGIFWLMTLPITGLAAAVAYVLDTRREFVEWQNHWGWDFLFALLYAMFIDRWIKEALLEDALPCDEVDEMRRSTIAVRFLTFAASICLLAIMVAPCPYVELNAVACAAAASVFVMLLPALAAHRPISLYEAFQLGRPVQAHLFLLIGGAILVSLLTGLGLSLVAMLLPAKPWVVAMVAGLHRLVDCLLLAGVGYGLAAIFRSLTDWQQPEPEDRPFRGMRLSTRKA